MKYLKTFENKKWYLHKNYWKISTDPIKYKIALKMIECTSESLINLNLKFKGRIYICMLTILDMIGLIYLIFDEKKLIEDGFRYMGEVIVPDYMVKLKNTIYKMRHLKLYEDIENYKKFWLISTEPKEYELNVNAIKST